MNYEDFIITVATSFISGIGFGLIIKSVWKFFLKLLRILRGKPELIQPVKFSKFFQTNEE